MTCSPNTRTWTWEDDDDDWPNDEDEPEDEAEMEQNWDTNERRGCLRWWAIGAGLLLLSHVTRYTLDQDLFTVLVGIGAMTLVVYMALENQKK